VRNDENMKRMFFYGTQCIMPGDSDDDVFTLLKKRDEETLRNAHINNQQTIQH